MPVRVIAGTTSPAPELSVVEETSPYIVEISDERDRVEIADGDPTHIVEISGDPGVVYIVEPISATPLTPPGPPVQGLIDAAITVHRDAAQPHPAYDDMISLRLLFENGLV